MQSHVAPPVWPISSAATSAWTAEVAAPQATVEARLALVRQLVHGNGGTVRHVRPVGGGARFVVSF
jgi:hypothetical protein